MKLNILISTHNERIADIEKILLPARDDVSYIVSCQYTKDNVLALIPKAFKRDDVSFLPMPGLGLSKNRNNSIMAADGDIAIIADDDVQYTDEYLTTIIETFKNNQDVDVALFKIKTPDNEPPMKRYPLVQCRFKERLTKNYYPSSIEIAFRVSAVKGNIFFDERFGLGSEFLNSGEEEVFLKDCMDKGLRVEFFPYYAVMHPYQSTGKNFLTQKSLRSRGAVSSYLHGLSSYIRMTKFSLFMALRGRSNIYNLMKNTLWGIMYERSSKK